MTQDLKYVGKDIPMHDIEEKVTGKVKYTGDMQLPGMLYAKLLLSDVAHGMIKKIDTSKAEALEGVVKVFTYENSSRILYNSHKWFVGLKTLEDEQLFTNHVKFVGDRVAAVVAKDRFTAERAVELIEVAYEELPVITDPEAALQDEKYAISKKEIKSGHADEILSKAELVFEDRIETPKIHHGAMETHVCVASPGPAGDITIWTPCQVAFQSRLLAAQVLDMPLNKVRVIKTTMGGSFGGKGQPVLEPICAFLAKAVGAPVKLLLDRRESIVATRTRTATIGTVKTAVDKEGHILARDIHMLVDTGAYFTNGDAVAIAMGKKSFRLYRIKDQNYRADIVYTNTPIGGACRGYGSPQIHAVSEIHMDNIARALHMDPVELRLRNLVHPYDLDPTGGPALGNARAIDCVEKGAEAFNWKGKRQRPKDTGRYVRGVGMACATHGNGYHGGYQDFITMSLRLTEDGGAFLNSGIHDLGCGTVTTMKQIVAEVLDMDTDKILAPEADTLVSPFDVAGTQASRVTFVCGGCAMKVAEMVREKFMEYASRIFGCTVEDIQMENGMIYNDKNQEERMSYGEMVIQIQSKFQDDVSVTYTYTSPANPAVYAANFVEVEIDTLTGLVRVVDVLAVHDIGKAINPGFVEGQIQGAIQMGIGLALTEEIKVDKRGKISGDTFSKYHVINAPDMPDVQVLLVEEGDEHGPFGAKSVGEISTCAIAPAIVNAINWALDVNITSLPVTPEKIMAALKDKNRY
ncbi:MAG: xanthine dehydrogenase family protein molybdopterin-binding subunit [Bacillota bacterium]